MARPRVRGERVAYDGVVRVLCILASSCALAACGGDDSRHGAPTDGGAGTSGAAGAAGQGAAGQGGGVPKALACSPCSYKVKGGGEDLELILENGKPAVAATVRGTAHPYATTWSADALGPGDGKDPVGPLVLEGAMAGDLRRIAIEVGLDGVVTGKALARKVTTTHVCLQPPMTSDSLVGLTLEKNADPPAPIAFDNPVTGKHVPGRVPWEPTSFRFRALPTDAKALAATAGSAPLDLTVSEVLGRPVGFDAKLGAWASSPGAAVSVTASLTSVNGVPNDPVPDLPLLAFGALVKGPVAFAALPADAVVWAGDAAVPTPEPGKLDLTSGGGVTLRWSVPGATSAKLTFTGSAPGPGGVLPTISVRWAVPGGASGVSLVTNGGSFSWGQGDEVWLVVHVPWLTVNTQTDSACAKSVTQVVHLDALAPG